jgi:TRAP-type C4-dicarboxylate transport system permease small subunit
MGTFTKIIRRILDAGMAIGSAFLLAMMVLIVANIIYRMTGHVIKGSYELSELFIVVTASFALGYAALHKSHVDVNIVVDKLPQRLQAILSAVTSFLTMATWALTAWAGSIILTDRWSSEESEMLLIPFYPFRTVLLIGLILVALVYLIDMILAVKETVKK